MILKRYSAPILFGLAALASGCNTNNQQVDPSKIPTANARSEEAQTRVIAKPNTNIDKLPSFEDYRSLSKEDFNNKIFDFLKSLAGKSKFFSAYYEAAKAKGYKFQSASAAMPPYMQAQFNNPELLGMTDKRNNVVYLKTSNNSTVRPDISFAGILIDEGAHVIGDANEPGGSDMNLTEEILRADLIKIFDGQKELTKSEKIIIDLVEEQVVSTIVRDLYQKQKSKPITEAIITDTIPGTLISAENIVIITSNTLEGRLRDLFPNADTDPSKETYRKIRERLTLRYAQQRIKTGEFHKSVQTRLMELGIIKSEAPEFDFEEIINKLRRNLGLSSSFSSARKSV